MQNLDIIKSDIIVNGYGRFENGYAMLWSIMGLDREQKKK